MTGFDRVCDRPPGNESRDPGVDVSQLPLKSEQCRGAGRGYGFSDRRGKLGLEVLVTHELPHRVRYTLSQPIGSGISVPRFTAGRNH